MLAGLTSDKMVCVGAQGIGFCHGDSGGPMTVKEDEQHTLAGIFSWAAGYAAVSTNMHIGCLKTKEKPH